MGQRAAVLIDQAPGKVGERWCRAPEPLGLPAGPLCWLLWWTPCRRRTGSFLQWLPAFLELWRISPAGWRSSGNLFSGPYSPPAEACLSESWSCTRSGTKSFQSFQERLFLLPPSPPSTPSFPTRPRPLSTLPASPHHHLPPILPPTPTPPPPPHSRSKWSHFSLEKTSFLNCWQVGLGFTA